MENLKLLKKYKFLKAEKAMLCCIRIMNTLLISCQEIAKVTRLLPFN